ncbi:PaaX family transcriptional regulator C-terminal domain-containing protein [Leucobacter japonicus]|uniref:PaaX family transcriptional regulator C-terminal domain-containing protein n=1 Tax=Leucobacter japonicus TaxID=1461259 RepID=UPI000B20DFA4|nr:PaaX family transcriptional regulator C-terminal domain-containing protein [Leucobacter japonicus]
MNGPAAAIAPRTIIEAVLRPGIAQSLAGLYDIAAAAGVEDQPVRLAIRRMVAAGEIVQQGRGRAGEIALTDTGAARLAAEAAIVRFVGDQDRGAVAWDGHWRLVSVHTTEGQRGIRDALRRGLTEAGAVALATGLYCSPHDLSGLLPADAADHLVVALAAQLQVRGERDPKRIAERCWPAEPVNAGYAQLEREVAEIIARPRTEAERTRSLLQLADALERALRPDPLLPAELRDANWRAPHARNAWRAAWHEISTATDGPNLYGGWLIE